MPGGTAVLWLRVSGDHSQSHQRWGRLMPGRLDGLTTCRSLGGAMPGGCWSPGLPSGYHHPAWVHEKRGSGGSTSRSLQHQGGQGSQVGPADNAPRLPPAHCSCRAGVAPSLSGPAELRASLLPRLYYCFVGRKQLPSSHLKLLTRCCLVCRSLLPSRAGMAPRLPWEDGLVPGACCRLYLPGDQQHPPAGLH